MLLLCLDVPEHAFGYIMISYGDKSRASVRKEIALTRAGYLKCGYVGS